jgi:branched-chain amino acid transport system permease protein
MMDPIILLQIAWTGIAISSYYVLFTIAFALALKVMQLWNFAQAGLMALAFYAMFFALNRLGLPLPLGIAFGVAVTVVAAVALEVFGLRTLRQRRSGNLTFFIFTLIVAEFIAYLLMMLFGTEPQTLFPSILSQVHIVMNIAISNWDLIAVGTTLVCATALWAFLRFHREGQFMLAVAENAGLAELYGISAKRAYLTTMIIVALISCAGMYLFGSRSGVFPTTPLELLLVAVIATLLGGKDACCSSRLSGRRWFFMSFSSSPSSSFRSASGCRYGCGRPSSRLREGSWSIFFRSSSSAAFM